MSGCLGELFPFWKDADVLGGYVRRVCGCDGVDELDRDGEGFEIL